MTSSPKLGYNTFVIFGAEELGNFDSLPFSRSVQQKDSKGQEGEKDARRRSQAGGNEALW